MLRTLFLLVTCCLGSGGESEQPLIVAHRGASYAAPENTLSAFRKAWEMGADAVEGDFYLTSDQRIVCIHDETTRRTAGVDLRVVDSTLAELKELDVGSWKSAKWTGERIPTLEEVLGTLPEEGKIFIELKSGPEIVAPLRELLARSAVALDRTVVISFDSDVIAAVKRAIPRITAHWITGYRQDKERGQWTPSLSDVLETVVACRADGLDTSANAEVVDASFIRALRERGLEFHVWTVNDPLDAARWQLRGVDSITTDRPAFIREGLLSRSLRESLQLWLPLDGDVADASHRGRDAKPRDTHGDDPGFVEAVFGKGLDLGAGGGARAFEYRLPPEGAICLWYRPAPWYDYQTILDNSAGENAWEMWIYESGRLRFRIHPKARGVDHRFHPTGDVHEWHHIAITWQRKGQTRARVKLFVNGRLTDSGVEEESLWTDPGGTVFLGGGHPKNSAGRGVWDDVAIFDCALRPGDIRYVMWNGVCALSALRGTDSR